MKGFFLGVKGDQRRNWAKDLIGCNGHIIADVFQDSRLVKTTTQVVPLATGNQLRSCSKRRLHQALYLDNSLLINQGPDVNTGFHAITHLKGGHSPGQFFGKRVLHRALHQKPVGADAGLACVTIL